MEGIMQQEFIEVLSREKLGKAHNKRLRKEGKIPGIVYGGDRGPVPIAIEEKDVWNMLHAETGENTVRLLRLAGTDMQRHVMIKDYQMDSITRRLLHADFIRVDVDQEVEVTVPVELKGTPVGVKDEGGMLDFVARELELKAKVLEIPRVIEIDVSDLSLNSAIRVKDLDVEKVEFLESPDKVIVKVEAMKVHSLEDEEEEVEEVEAESAE
jgi:large subunit ribosomal protein L25